ncbi:DUF1294 domain-containing protein [Shinella curvata]|uniref:DUF1294 domain-containing protein n=1 Tax=Shinella curvata TaxID=1817964 RepID=A0ABT8XH35_9HYPH|nr:DUF1294 domain-containing protein [Shinella curvata]MCJ8053720.1 DUF1294 domain-containing protein [Shinella curvata]MDO6123052.1 DUF1294 domain-containing protein [Shinella curvata]
MNTTTALLIIFLLLNVVTFCLFWRDKDASRNGGWRVSEASLLQFAFFGGSLGAVAAQRLLRHKTRKEPFRSYLMTILILHAVLAPMGLIFGPTIVHMLQAG